MSRRKNINGTEALTKEEGQIKSPLPEGEGWGGALKKAFFYTAGTVAIFLIGRSVVRAAVSNHEERKTFDEGSPATYAKQIQMAFENDGWPGTNTKELRRLLTEIPSRQDTDKVDTAYQRLYHVPLNKKMSDELQSSEYNEMLAIIKAKPDRIRKKKKGDAPAIKPGITQYEEWAKRLKAAFDKTYGPIPGTDEDAVVAVLNEVPTQNDFLLVAAHYTKIYNRKLIDDLKDEGTDSEYHAWMKLILDKPKQ